MACILLIYRSPLKLNPLKRITKDSPFKICFVCLGNICRSPTAEGIFQHLVNERGLQSYFEVDSAGTSAYHSGQSADRNAQHVANENNINLYSKARRLEPFDLGYFDLIVAMDLENYSNIQNLDSGSKYRDKIVLLRGFDPEPEDKQVPDPYYGGMDGFKNVFEIVSRSCEKLLNELEGKIEK